VQQALDAEINHFDVAASYGDAELRLGPWMSRIRDQIFLATKVEERAADRAWASINRSLERLRVDRVDLLQLHAVGDLATLDSVTREGGALESAVRAMDEGMVGAIGITGHGREAAATHLEGLRRYPFATVLTPLNPVLWREDEFRSAYGALVDEVRSQDVGLMTIKTISRRNWPDPHGGHSYATWYEPWDDAERIRAAVSWVLSHEEITGLATAGDVRLLGMIIAAEQDRLDASAAEDALGDDAEYSSPFLAMPI
jgi:predicted aldo/keto reductase-like oxidoreductase